MSEKNGQVERLAFSIAETAQALGVSSRSVHDYVKNGSIPHFRMGTRVLIEVAALREFIAGRTQTQNPNQRKEQLS
jgi:excisionase family DNA binding protein